MNIFDRIAMLFRSNVNAVISEFEQPEKMLNQIILGLLEFRDHRVDVGPK